MSRRWASLLAMFVLAGVVAAPTAALASTTEAIGDTGGMTLELTLLGAPVGVVVTLDEIGHITMVEISDPDFTEDRADGHKVRFSNDGETTRIEVRAKKDKLRADLKTAAVADILGTHTWKGMLFGSADESVVTFDVVDDGGVPELANVSVVSLFPAGATADVGAVENSSDEGEAESEVKVEFRSNGFEMQLRIKVELDVDEDDDDDDARPVHLRIELRGKDEQRLRGVLLDTIVGEHVWSGRLCDATAITVTYTIGADGALTFDSASAPVTFELKNKDHGFEVRFDDSDAKVKVELEQKDDGTWDLKVRSKTTEKCDHDAEGDDDQDGKRGDDDHDEKRGDDDNGEHNNDDDDNHKGD